MFNRIPQAGESSDPLPQEQKGSVFNRLDDGNEVQSSIPSRIKRYSTLDVKTDGLFRVRRCTVVFTGQPSNSDINKGDDQEKVTSNHIIVQGHEDSETEIEIAETPKTLEDGV